MACPRVSVALGNIAGSSDVLFITHADEHLDKTSSHCGNMLLLPLFPVSLGLRQIPLKYLTNTNYLPTATRLCWVEDGSGKMHVYS